MIPSSVPPPAQPSRRPTSSPAPSGFLPAWRALNGHEKRFIVLWAMLLLGTATLAFAFLTTQQRRNVERAATQNAARMSTTVAVQGHTQPERTPPPGHETDVPREVEVGIYLNRISEFSILDSSWKADFYIWFRWSGEGIDPGETFKMATGELLNRELLKKSDAGDRHYALYRASAQISKKFDISRFPRDEHQLLITIEDRALESYQLVYKTDPSESDVSSRADVPGYDIVSLKTNVKPHSYKRPMGDPDLPRDFKATYSQFITGILIARPTWGLFIKMFVALFIAMLLAIGGLFLASPSERLALGGTAIFVAIMNAEANASLVPATGMATLGDVIDSIGYIAMGVVIIQSIVYHRLVRDGEPGPVCLVFDRVSIALIPVLYVALNAGVLFAA